MSSEAFRELNRALRDYRDAVARTERVERDPEYLAPNMILDTAHEREGAARIAVINAAKEAGAK